jgi:predicted CXXCH cytochrome family protein
LETTETAFDLYDSTTFDAGDTGDYGQPDGSSRMCLSCHDGTGTFSDPNHSFGTDLSGHHPISFTYDTSTASGEAGLNDPNATDSGLGSTIDNDLLEDGDQLECVSCHDVHNTVHTTMALNQTNTTGQLCKRCHNK